jgi:hypothetical protein
MQWSVRFKIEQMLGAMDWFLVVQNVHLKPRSSPFYAIRRGKEGARSFRWLLWRSTPSPEVNDTGKTKRNIFY